PVAGIVVPLIHKAHGDPVAGERPELLDKPVVKLAGPLPLQESNDRGSPGEELGAVAPAAILAIGERYTLGLARVPGVLGHPHLLHGAFTREWRKRRARGCSLLVRTGFGFRRCRGHNVL